MTIDFELIKKIKKLKRIRPRKGWVLLTKSQILGLEEKTKFELFPFFKPVYAGLFCFLILIGLFEISQSALPGEPLFPLKRAAERVQIALVSEEGLLKLDLELANKRLEELSQIAEENGARKLAPAITEFQVNVSEAAKDLAKVRKIDQEIIVQTQKLEENKEKVERVLATKIETEEYDNALAQLVERLIQELEENTLSELDQEVLGEAKEDFENGDYSEALIKILDLSQR